MSEDGPEIQLDPLVEKPLTLEQKDRNHQIAFTTSVMCRNWYDGELKDEHDVDKIRGDLALETITRAADRGFQVVTVVDNQSRQFADVLREKGLAVYEQDENNLSGSRRQAIRIATKLKGIKAIVTAEPEKTPIVDSLQRLTQPVLDGEADVVMPKREVIAFDTYPPEQAKREKQANAITNRFLRKEGLLPQDAPDLDFWVGVRVIRNDPKIIDLFMAKEQYKFDEHAEEVIDEKHIDPQIFNLDTWANALYIPIVKALRTGLRVKGVEIPYKHPPQQTQSEIGDPSFDAKRLLQLKNIILAMVQEGKTKNQSVKPKEIEIVESPEKR